MKNSDKISCCIVIPIYKKIPSSNEIASLKQVLAILESYQICFVCAEKFDYSNYTKILSNKQIYFIEHFKTSYFLSIDGYNKLLLSIDFYKRFKSFNYILIYQLDAWVFKNNLDLWCNLNLAYIGAPWLHKNELGEIQFDGIGNGGLSLRKVSSHIKVLQSFSWINKPGYYLYLFNRKKTFLSLIELIKGLTFWNNSHHYFNSFEGNEDKFWGIVAKRNFSWFNVADYQTAKKFSIEMFPSLLIKSDIDLPFGCHAWEKYDPIFWQKYISL